MVDAVMLMSFSSPGYLLNSLALRTVIDAARIAVRAIDVILS